MTLPENLWGLDEIPPADEAVPRTLLAEQASLLDKITNGTVFATVITNKAIVGNKITHHMKVFSPDFEGYGFIPMSTTHDIALMYPCTIQNHLTDKAADCINEEQLRSKIKEVLSSDDVVKRIRALMAQARAMRTSPNAA